MGWLSLLVILNGSWQILLLATAIIMWFVAIFIFPKSKKHQMMKGEVTYLISGDWVENLSSLEYQNGKWRIYHLLEDLPALRACNMEKEAKTVALSNNGVLKNLIKEFNVVKTKETR